ncbi:unnamed protein product [Paramecium sonneborni]|uniref:Transmembrane protein n=1 Tax=Paramecium sonneborni TaxID=65129 RepID=A0A8S1RJJ8_9CILI|nr:unnamed protein product [Paramecium sonneborni]
MIVFVIFFLLDQFFISNQQVNNYHHQLLNYQNIFKKEKNYRYGWNVSSEMMKIFVINQIQMLESNKLIVFVIETAKFDILRMNYLTNSPIKYPVMQATNKMKEVQNKDKDQQMFMRTPIITEHVKNPICRVQFKNYNQNKIDIFYIFVVNNKHQQEMFF